MIVKRLLFLSCIKGEGCNGLLIVDESINRRAFTIVVYASNRYVF